MLIKNTKQLNNILLEIDKKARHQTAIQVHDKLQDILVEYFYNNYKPNHYKRTYQLIDRSPKIDEYDEFETIVGMYSDGINYEDDVASVINLAMQGYHGATSIVGSQHYEVWNIFLEWCNENVIKIYKQNLDDIAKGLQF